MYIRNDYGCRDLIGFLCVYVTRGDASQCDCIWLRLFTNSRYGEKRFFDEYYFHPFDHTGDLLLPTHRTTTRYRGIPGVFEVRLW